MIWGVLCSPADVYHLGKPQPVNGLAALLAVRLLRRQPFVIDCDDDEATSNQFTAAWQRGVFAFWQMLLPHLAAGATVNTRTLAARMPDRLPVTYVPNGVDMAAFQRPPTEVLHGLRRALNLEGRRVVAYSGTLGLYNHPIDLLFDAFTLVLRAVPDAILLIIGGGPDATLLRARLEAQGILPHVRWIGYVPHTSTRAYLALATVSADPVRDDAVAQARSPLKLFESLALGVPVVTGAVGDRAEWLAHGGAGRLVLPDSAEALAEGIVELLCNAELCERMAQAAQQQARRYDWHILAGHWLQGYAAPQAAAGYDCGRQ
jgi:glycosyltransferase involved in cell wall biosynthesis